MCGNPPWDKIEVEDKKWFESHWCADVVNAGTAEQRKRAIVNLPINDPVLYDSTRCKCNKPFCSIFWQIPTYSKG